ncbi:MAG TPA: hypothetical protein ENI52_04720 [Thermoplasmata archaeon]|nr:hypothetical protein [Thermoplasmata archaeon]
MEETLQAFLSAFAIITLPIVLSQLSINLTGKNKMKIYNYISLYLSIIALLAVLAISPLFVYLKIYLDAFIQNSSQPEIASISYFFLGSAIPFLAIGYDFIPFASLLICIKSFNLNKKLSYGITGLVIGAYLGIVLEQLREMYL